MDAKSIISEARLGTYLRFTGNNEDKAIELHNMTLQLGASLSAAIAQIELGLRNLVNDQLIQDFGDPNWMLDIANNEVTNTSVPLKARDKRLLTDAKKQVQKAAYAKLSYQEKKALETRVFPNGVPANMDDGEITGQKRAKLQYNQGQLIAQTTIFLWKRLFSRDYEALLWKPSLKKVFPQKEIKRSDVSSHLETIYMSRNRVAHHEPVYADRLDKLFESIQYIRKNLGRRKDDDVTAFETFTEIQFYRLYIDYATFKNSWALLTHDESI